MPNDTKYIVNGAQLTDIGAAIRSKLGEQDTYTVDEMPGKIGIISGGGGDIPLLTITFNLSNGLLIGDEALYNRYDNNVLYPQQLILDRGTSVVTYMGVEVDTDTILGLAFFVTNETVTDLVNCILVDGSEETPSMILITDPTQNSSATITN